MKYLFYELIDSQKNVLAKKHFAAYSVSGDFVRLRDGRRIDGAINLQKAITEASMKIGIRPSEVFVRVDTPLI